MGKLILFLFKLVVLFGLSSLSVFSKDSFRSRGFFYFLLEYRVRGRIILLLGCRLNKEVGRVMFGSCRIVGFKV